MKSSKKLKLTLMILICVLIILIGFLGIYSKKGNSYKNKLPNYKLTSDLKGSTILELEVDDSTETIYYDKDGNKVDSSDVTEENEADYTKEEVPVNAEENLTKENYEKVIDIMKQRLSFLKADQYKLDLDKKSGKIILTFEDDYPDDIKSFIKMEGKLEFVDSTTEDVILSHNDFSKAEATYAALDNGSYNVYVNLKLNKSGLEKINDIDKYKTAETSEDEEKTDTTENKAQLLFDGEEIAEVSYDKILLNNKTLRITIAESLTSNSTINSKLNTSTIVSKFATMGKLPVAYSISAEEYINSSVANYLEYIVFGIAGICVAISLYLIIKYKTEGMLAVIAFVANIALFLILIRITDVQVSLNGLAGILGLMVLNTVLLNNILKNIKNKDKAFLENIKNAYINSIDTFVIMLIVLVVFAFSNMTVINSMGLLVFWGWIVVALGNLILTVPMLYIASKK